MKLSIITICKNEPNLRRTLDSINNQTFKDFEWIVIDGKSDSKIIKIFDEYRDRINFFTSEADRGIYNAYNKAIKKAHGEYVCFMNTGDVFYDDMVLENVFCRKQTADILYGNTNIIKGKKSYIEEAPDTIDKYFFMYGTINHQSCFIKTSLFKKYGLYNESYKIASDFEKFIVFAKHNVCFKKLNLVIATYYKNGISSNKSKTHREFEKIKHSLFSVNEFDEFEKRKKEIKFLFIPIISVIERFPKTYFKLFGLLTILKQKRTKIYLFGLKFLPILTIKER